MHARTAIALGTAGIFLALAAPNDALAQDPGVVMQAGVQHPLARTWILNVEKSDDAQEKMQQAQRRRSGPAEDDGASRGARPQGQRRNRGTDEPQKEQRHLVSLLVGVGAGGRRTGMIGSDGTGKRPS